MLTGIDHIVIVLRDLEAAVKSYERLGFTVVPGGRHPIGTYNALISLADGAYIELIAFYEGNPNHRWWAPLQRGGGLVDFCMQTDNLTGDTTGFRGAGVEIDDPRPLTRTRPDGYQLRWFLSIPREGHRGVAPFLIQDETPREERIPREMAHKNGATGIGTVTVAVDDLPIVRQWYKSVLGYDGRPAEWDNLKGSGIRFKIGPHFLDFVKPTTQDSPLADWLKARGPSPYAAT
ncbi:MAG: VOC family protein, partial [Candidatus Binatia bacterium]